MDTSQMISALGLVGDDPEPETPETPDEQDSAAESAATPTDTTTSEDEPISLDEAMAGLDGQAAPLPDPASEEPTTEPAVAPDVAELQRQVDEYKAKEALIQAQQAEAEFISPWQNQQAINDDFFESEIARMTRVAKEKGYSDEFLKASIYQRVELGEPDEYGNVFGVERFNPRTRTMETIGRIQADSELLQNYAAAVRTFERAKTQPSAFDQLVTQYDLTTEDRTALGKYVGNVPPAMLAEIAQDLSAKNQRIQSTQQHARDQAAANVGAKLSQGIAPGIPGATRTQKEYVYTHAPGVRQQETELFARKLGLIRSA